MNRVHVSEVFYQAASAEEQSLLARVNSLQDELGAAAQATATRKEADARTAGNLEAEILLARHGLAGAESRLQREVDQAVERGERQEELATREAAELRRPLKEFETKEKAQATALGQARLDYKNSAEKLE